MLSYFLPEPADLYQWMDWSGVADSDSGSLEPYPQCCKLTKLLTQLHTHTVIDYWVSPRYWLSECVTVTDQLCKLVSHYVNKCNYTFS